MREIRTSGSEGGAAQANAPSLPLYRSGSAQSMSKMRVHGVQNVLVVVSSVPDEMDRNTSRRALHRNGCPEYKPIKDP